MSRLSKVTGDYVRMQRGMRDLSKRALALKLRVSVYYLNKIENGELDELKGGILFRLAKAFDAKPVSVLRDISEMYSGRYPKKIVAEEKVAPRQIWKSLSLSSSEKGHDHTAGFKSIQSPNETDLKD